MSISVIGRLVEIAFFSLEFRPVLRHCNLVARTRVPWKGTSMALPRSPHYSVDEYLARERESASRHEYLHGQIYDMAGESLQHSRIYINLAGEVSSQLKGRECEALSPNMKVKTGD